MANQIPRCWLVTPDGCQVHVNDEGLIIGRGPSCGLSLSPADVSRTHALVLLTQQGPVLYHLGRNPTYLHGKAITESVPLEHGDVVSVAGIEIRVGVDLQQKDSTPLLWMIESGEAVAFRIQRFPFVVGGDSKDNLVINGWPTAAVRLMANEDALLAELAAPARLNGQAQDIGAALLRSDDVLEIAGKAVRFQAVDLDGGSVAPTLPSGCLQEVRLHRFPERGGLLTLYYQVGAKSVFLPERRCDLIAVLLERTAAYVTDEEIIRRVWPREPDKTRCDVNVLLHRLRSDLDKADIHSGLLERAPGGGALRFLADARVAIVIE